MRPAVRWRARRDGTLCDMTGETSDIAKGLLRLTLVPGLGPIRIKALLEKFHSPDRVFGASQKDLTQVDGIGEKNSRAILTAAPDSEHAAQEELDRANALAVRVLCIGEPDYPSLLARIPDPPPILYVRGTIDPDGLDAIGLAIVGSRDCSAYGVEQAERFAGTLAASGITIVSGGARGIDSAAHRSALRAKGRTIAVLGCGLSVCYPPENDRLFAQIAENGAVISELPIATQPEAKNFPARNRLISGMSLGTLVVEAGRRSGALITARLALDDHDREVMAIPGRLDSPSALGCLDLIKKREAALVTEPGDVLEVLKPHAHNRSRELRANAADTPVKTDEPALFPTDSPARTAILSALAEPLTLDQIVEKTRLGVPAVMAELTMLEMQRRVKRAGPLFEAR